MRASAIVESDKDLTTKPRSHEATKRILWICWYSLKDLSFNPSCLSAFVAKTICGANQKLILFQEYASGPFKY
jgi:hypothetical protein